MENYVLNDYRIDYRREAIVSNFLHDHCGGEFGLYSDLGEALMLAVKRAMKQIAWGKPLPTTVTKKQETLGLGDGMLPLLHAELVAALLEHTERVTADLQPAIDLLAGLQDQLPAVV